MKVNKTYIIYIDTPISKEYAAETAKSCDKLGIEYEIFKGYKPRNEHELWSNFVNTAGIPIKQYKRMAIGAAGCTASHAHLWKKIADNKECAVILEHDAMMLHPVTIDIPDDKIVSLGYKYQAWDKYDYEKAGPPKRIVDVKHSPGSHAYAITHVMAQNLVDDLISEGITEAIDNRHFMHTRTNFTKRKIGIIDPIAGIGWLRKSTIQGWSATHNNIEEMLESFKENFDSTLREMPKR